MYSTHVCSVNIAAGLRLAYNSISAVCFIVITTESVHINEGTLANIHLKKTKENRLINVSWKLLQGCGAKVHNTTNPAIEQDTNEKTISAVRLQSYL